MGRGRQHVRAVCVHDRGRAGLRHERNTKRVTRRRRPVAVELAHQAGLQRVGMDDGEPVPGPVWLDDVDHAPRARRGERHLGNGREGRLQLERRAESCSLSAVKSKRSAIVR